ncbi:MAG TPA: hypothetical protein DCS21_11540 [Gammaproteobacteria bacterium]|nr:hypothetical protein [Gammaproteobacteria bacterium]
MKKVASLKYGVVFKKAFCDPEIFSAFVRDIIGLPVTVDYVETEKEFDPPVGYVKPRFDLFAQDHKHRIVIDIQHTRNADHYDRFFYYHCIALLEQVVKAGNYRPPLKVFTLVVLTSGDRHQTDMAVIDCDPHDRAGKPLQEVPHKVIYLCPKYVGDQTPEPYREWLRAIRDTLDEEVDETQYQRPEIHKLFEAIRRDHLSPEERARMIDENNLNEWQQTNLLAQRMDIARQLLKEGVSRQIIAKATGFSATELQTIASGATLPTVLE